MTLLARESLLLVRPRIKYHSNSFKDLLSSSVSILCPCVMCQDLKNEHRLTLKSLFTTPTMKLFLVSYERYGQINTFLLRYYGTDFASIKRYDQFCFLLMYIRRHRFSLISLFSLLYLSLHLLSLSSFSLLLPSAHSLFSLSSFSLLSAHSLLSLCLFSISSLLLSSFSTYFLFLFALCSFPALSLFVLYVIPPS